MMKQRILRQGLDIVLLYLMDWVVKSSAWDVSGLGQEEDNTRFIALNGSDRLVDGRSGGGLIDNLTLGRLRDLQEGAMDEERKGLTTLPLPIGSKKTHSPSCTKNVLCLVDGCSSDLSKCREYHRRHRVCERHSKTPVVIIKGREQRFCQQCSRFHPLEEFDEVKRSCRKRLDGHNRRRRKPRQESLYTSSHSFLSDCKGTSWLRFGGPQEYESRGTTSGGISISWPDNNKLLYSSLKAFSVIDEEIPFLMATNPGKSFYQNPELAISRKLVKANDTSVSDCSQLMVSDKLTYLEESKCALSLLSTDHTQSVRTIAKPSGQQNIFNLSQPMATNLHFNELYPYPCPQGMEEKSVGANVTPDADIYDCISNRISPLFQGAV